MIVVRTDGRVHFPTTHGELSTYMATYWRVNTAAPASDMIVRRKQIPCHRASRL